MDFCPCEPCRTEGRQESHKWSSLKMICECGESGAKLSTTNSACWGSFKKEKNWKKKKKKNKERKRRLWKQSPQEVGLGWAGVFCREREVMSMEGEIRVEREGRQKEARAVEEETCGTRGRTEQVRRSLGKNGRVTESSEEDFRLSLAAKGTHGSCRGAAAHERRVLGSYDFRGNGEEERLLKHAHAKYQGWR